MIRACLSFINLLITNHHQSTNYSDHFYHCTCISSIIKAQNLVQSADWLTLGHHRQGKSRWKKKKQKENHRGLQSQTLQDLWPLALAKVSFIRYKPSTVLVVGNLTWTGGRSSRYNDCNHFRWRLKSPSSSLFFFFSMSGHPKFRSDSGEWLSGGEKLLLYASESTLAVALLLVSRHLLSEFHRFVLNLLLQGQLRKQWQGKGKSMMRLGKRHIRLHYWNSDRYRPSFPRGTTKPWAFIIKKLAFTRHGYRYVLIEKVVLTRGDSEAKTLSSQCRWVSKISEKKSQFRA